jgi:NADH-quinone oxidoreductase subunit K
MITLQHYLLISAALFSLGILAIMTRKNAINVLMGIELMLNAANINFIAFSKYSGANLDGQLVSIFVIILAACEAAVALAIVLNMFHQFNTVNVDEVHSLKD